MDKDGHTGATVNNYHRGAGISANPFRFSPLEFRPPSLAVLFWGPSARSGIQALTEFHLHPIC